MKWRVILVVAAFGGMLGVAGAINSLCPPASLSDTELAATVGGQSASWCRDIDVCSYPDRSTCPLGTALCANYPVGKQCGFKLEYSWAEVCDPFMGGETCSGNPPRKNVVCSWPVTCLCEDTQQGRTCTDEVYGDPMCMNIPTEFYCEFETEGCDAP